MDLDRRRVLRLTGATATASMAALAGCTSADDGDDDDENGADDNDENGDTETETDSEDETGESAGLHDYERWLTSDADGELLFSYVDWAGLGEFEDDDDEPVPDEDDADVEDPMIELPMVGALIAAMSAGFAAPSAGLGPIVDLEDDTLAADDAETTLDELLFVNETLLFLGDVATDEVVDALTEPDDDPYAAGATFDHVDDVGDFELYESETDDDGFGAASSQAVAVGADAILLANDSEDVDGVDHVRSVLEAAEGDRERATDEREEFDWTLETAGEGHVVLGGYGGEEDLDDVEEANTIVSSLTFDADGGAEGDFAATFETIDDETESELETELGATADDRTLDIEDDRVTAWASWDADNEALE
ncbi:hypothetical protein [Natronorubrum texcoconense]|uniref:Uncharacterized protein n=1 Tax=Natronorubrum texcoconense TaxID=1095776 RepID=A0A1G8UQA3_9EURY|nr:hypothetical protein [Natronorubrum texcoconense]SDJ55981.1 hypothetical protein SAMN04515672_0986 [Natronorubrum texcoconense]